MPIVDLKNFHEAMAIIDSEVEWLAEINADLLAAIEKAEA